jgi:protein SCO1/2
MKRPILGIYLVLAIAILVIAGSVFWFSARDDRQAATILGSSSTGEALVGGPFDLIDHTGRRVTDADFRGKWLLVFFGYTHCPDACPLSLHEIAIALDHLGDAGRDVDALFISIDPERDTPEVLAEFVGAFHERIIGLTGTPEQVEAAAKAYRVYYQKRTDGDPVYYLVDHTTAIYFMGPDGKYVTHFRYDIGGVEMAEQMRTHLSQS